MLKRFFVTLILVSLLIFPGCARVPSGIITSNTRQLVVTMTVAGQIDPNAYYFVVFNSNSTTDSSSGPVPVVSSPWGNGFVADSATHFVEYHGSLPGDGYGVFQFIPGSNLLQFSSLGVPSQDTPVTSGSSILQFRIPLSTLTTSAISLSQLQTLQINFITTNFLPVNPNDVNPSSPKYFDALGNTSPGSGQLNNFISISANQSGLYNNSISHNEPMGDVVSTVGGGILTSVNQPNLDIVDWSVQITSS